MKAKMTSAVNAIKSTLKHDGMAASRAYGAAMGNLAGGGKIGSTLKTAGRDLMRDIGGKRLAMYGGGAAAGVGATAWGLSGDE
jgi:hypothetical protein